MRLVITAIVLTAALTGCGSVSMHGGDDDSPGIAATGSGNSRSYAVDGFTKVSLAGPDRVDVRVGPAFSVRADGDGDVLGVLRIRRDGDGLVVDRRPGIHFTGQPAHVTVTLPVLRAAGLAGSGTMTVDRVQGDRFTVDAAGSGQMRIGTLATQRTDLNVAGSSDVSAAGSAGELHVSIAGSGNVAAPQLTATRASVSIAGSGNVRAAVNGSASVQILGSGDVDLGPQSQCTVSQMGSGHVTCGTTGGGSGGGDRDDDTADNSADDQ